MNTRQMSVCGTFYPSSQAEINKYINHFDKVLEELNFNVNCDFIPRAIISPHAGYVYSGFTANIAFHIIKHKINPKRIIVIGPSHKFRFQGASVSLYENYETPLGALEIDLEYAQILEQEYDFLSFDDKIHCEHSTETQMPFIKHYFPNTKVVEIVYSDCSYQNISNVIDKILKDDDNFIVISTDLSHFHTFDEAKKLDNICLNAINNLDINQFNQGCESCGITGVKAIVKYAKDKSMRVQLLDYRTSADVSNDKTSVVGYSSFVLGN